MIRRGFGFCLLHDLVECPLLQCWFGKFFLHFGQLRWGNSTVCIGWNRALAVLTICIFQVRGHFSLTELRRHNNQPIRILVRLNDWVYLAKPVPILARLCLASGLACIPHFLQNFASYFVVLLPQGPDGVSILLLAVVWVFDHLHDGLYGPRGSGRSYKFLMDGLICAIPHFYVTLRAPVHFYIYRIINYKIFCF